MVSVGLDDVLALLRSWQSGQTFVTVEGSFVDALFIIRGRVWVVAESGVEVQSLDGSSTTSFRVSAAVRFISVPPTVEPDEDGMVMDGGFIAYLLPDDDEVWVAFSTSHRA